MLTLLTDEIFNARIVDAVRRREPSVDILTVADVDLLQTPDPIILERAAALGRVFVTSDVQTMPNFAYRRIDQGLPMPGLIVVPMFVRVGLAAEDLLTIAYCSHPSELANQVRYVPIRH